MGQVVQISEQNCKLSDFDLFWECYPRKKAKLDALRAWKQTEAVRPDMEQILAAINQAVQSGEWQDPRFIPYPATWLRAGRWDDE